MPHYLPTSQKKASQKLKYKHTSNNFNEFCEKLQFHFLSHKIYVKFYKNTFLLKYLSVNMYYIDFSIKILSKQYISL